MQLLQQLLLQLCCMWVYVPGLATKLLGSCAGPLPEAWTNYTKLSSLQLDSNQLTSVPISWTQMGLELLDLSKNALTGAGVSASPRAAFLCACWQQTPQALLRCH